MKRIAAGLLLISVLVACSSVKPYAAKVDGSIIANQDVAMLASANEFLNDSTATGLAPLSTLPTSNATQILAPLIRYQVVKAYVETKDWKSGDRLRREFISEVASSPQGTEVIRRFQSLDKDAQNLLIDLTVNQYLFNASASGYKPSSTADIICTTRWIFLKQEDATAAASQPEEQRGATAAGVTDQCTLDTPDRFNEPLTAARRTATGSTTAPVAADEQGTPTWQLIKVQKRYAAKAKQWPLEVFNGLSQEKSALLFDRIFAKTDVLVSPEYGKLVAPTAQCVSPCIIPPEQPLLQETTTTAPQQFSFG